ncbi:MAG: sulfotransferase [Hyphomicrobiaceae bacterium]|nr:sulfotransferase [Hyphomicrobiaceae bacterium]
MTAPATALAPIFLVSLPRSGSTLLQKVLATTPEIATASEPWIALPVAYMTRRDGIATEYWQASAADALEDVAAALPGGRDQLRAMQAGLVRATYAALAAGAPDARYFLDKTPRYYLILDFLAEAFPDARFVFLFRHPLDVASSILASWHKDTFTPHLRSNDIDLWHGPRMMADGFHRLADRSVRVDYETLVADPGTAITELARFLALDRLPADPVAAARDVEFTGRMGDPARGRRYEGVAAHSVDRWRASMRNPYRRAFFRSYVRSLDAATLQAFGLDREALLQNLAQAPVSTSGLLRDIVGINWYRLSKSLHALHLEPGLRPLPRRDRQRRQLG